MHDDSAELEQANWDAEVRLDKSREQEPRYPSAFLSTPPLFPAFDATVFHCAYFTLFEGTSPGSADALRTWAKRRGYEVSDRSVRDGDRDIRVLEVEHGRAVIKVHLPEVPR